MDQITTLAEMGANAQAVTWAMAGGLVAGGWMIFNDALRQAMGKPEWDTWHPLRWAHEKLARRR